MIERYVRDQASRGFDGIHRIEASAHAHFEYRYFGAGIGQYDERRQRSVFEIGQRYITPHGLDAFERSYDLLIGCVDAVNANALVVDLNVRRRIAADIASRSPKQRFEHRHGGTLAIGSCDVEESRRKLECQAIEHRSDPVETELDLIGRQRLEPDQPVG